MKVSGYNQLLSFRCRYYTTSAPPPQGAISPPLPLIGAAHQIVQTDIEEIGEGDQSRKVRCSAGVFVALVCDKRYSELLWHNSEVSSQAVQLCRSLPGYDAAKRNCHAASEQLRAVAGYELYDQYITQLGALLEYENLSYYALGLGLREAFVRELCM